MKVLVEDGVYYYICNIDYNKDIDIGNIEKVLKYINKKLVGVLNLVNDVKADEELFSYVHINDIYDDAYEDILNYEIIGKMSYELFEYFLDNWEEDIEIWKRKGDNKNIERYNNLRKNYKKYIDLAKVKDIVK